MSARAGMAGALLGVAVARVAYAALRRRPPGGSAAWTRTNHQGEPVTLLAGPAYSVAAGTSLLATPGLPTQVRYAGALAAFGAGACGVYDDLAGSGGSRGFAGHLGALRRGEVTSGAVKLLGIGATGVGTAALLTPRTAGTVHVVDTALTGAVVAASANLVNLFDLRPGRAVKVSVLSAAPLLVGRNADVAAAPLAAAVALLPDDLGERAMLGDAGANALGATLGLAAVSELGRAGRVALLAGLAGLTAASELVSFSRVISAVGPLRWFDELGRVRTAWPAVRGRPAADG